MAESIFIAKDRREGRAKYVKWLNNSLKKDVTEYLRGIAFFQNLKSQIGVN